jgi:hypothetical protein
MPKFHCIHCGQHIDAPNEMEGTKASCPTCGGDIEVPKNPSMPHKSIQHQYNVGAAEKKSGIGSLIGSIIFIAVVGAFASVVGKSCGKSLANEHINEQQTIQNHPNKNELEYFNVAGIRLLLPSKPIVSSTSLPPGTENILKSLKTYKVPGQPFMIGITHAFYIQPEVNIEASAEGSIAEVRNIPSVSAFTGSSKETVVAGMAGREMTMNYMNSKYEVDQYGLVFASGGEWWQIQIIGDAIQHGDSLEILKKSIFESIQISDNE